MRAGSVWADDQALGNLSSRQPLCIEARDLQLPPAEGTALGPWASHRLRTDSETTQHAAGALDVTLRSQPLEDRQALLRGGDRAIATTGQPCPFEARTGSVERELEGGEDIRRACQGSP